MCINGEYSGVGSDVLGGNSMWNGSDVVVWWCGDWRSVSFCATPPPFL